MEVFWKLAISQICLMNCLMQIHPPSELPLRVHTIWRNWLCLFLLRVDLEIVRRGSFTPVVFGKASHWTHILCRWTEKPSGCSRNDKVWGQPGLHCLAWSSLNLARWLTSLGAQSMEGRGPAGVRASLIALRLHEVLQGLLWTLGFRTQAGELREQLAAGEEKRQSFEESARWQSQSVCAWPSILTSGWGARSAKELHWWKCWQVLGGIFSFFCLDLTAIVWEAGKQFGFVLNALARSLRHFFLSKCFELGPIT